MHERTRAALGRAQVLEEAGEHVAGVVEDELHIDVRGGCSDLLQVARCAEVDPDLPVSWPWLGSRQACRQSMPIAGEGNLMQARARAAQSCPHASPVTQMADTPCIFFINDEHTQRLKQARLPGGCADLANRRKPFCWGRGGGAGAHLAELALGERLLELGVRRVKQAVLQRHQDDVDALARQRLS